jgi:hypothetical protein
MVDVKVPELIVGPVLLKFSISCINIVKCSRSAKDLLVYYH